MGEQKKFVSRRARADCDSFGPKSQASEVIAGAPCMRVESVRSRLVQLLEVMPLRGAQLYQAAGTRIPDVVFFSKKQLFF